jgi:NAD(P)-dependent dehydrogenase (short-subunit alcohol dehydrogenase family)
MRLRRASSSSYWNSSNLTAVFPCSRLAHPYMKRRGGGATVNVASIVGLWGGI